MELRHLKYFVAVADELHFRRAAERLHIAQPAISEQVRKLEQELGVQLFDRAPRSVSLTAAGAAMLEEARRVLRQAEVAAHVARTARDRATLRLRIGYVPDSLPAVISRALRQLPGLVPNVDVHLEASVSLRLIHDLHAGRLDAAVVNLPAAVGRVRSTPLGHQHPIAAVPVGHRQATASAIVLEWAARDRLVVLPHELNPAFRSAVVAMCRDAGLSPTFIEVANVDHALLAVSAGSGIALLPESAAERHVGAGIRFLPVRGAEPAFESALLTDPDRENVATLAFVRAARAATTRTVPTPAARQMSRVS